MIKNVHPCDFFHRVHNRGKGDCRINPPTLFYFLNGAEGVTFVSNWPDVEDSDWCGKFKINYSAIDHALETEKESPEPTTVEKLKQTGAELLDKIKSRKTPENKDKK